MRRLSFPTLRATMCVPAAAVLAACGDPCVNTERARVRSPDGAHEVVAFHRACAGTTGPSAQVSVVAPGARVVGVGNVFAAERDLPVDVHWTGPTVLRVRYPRAGNVGTRPEIGPVRISFDSLTLPRADTLVRAPGPP